jgi:EAL domain-containing protein (putative c-di-GMP-specific phosphodiesterase class I)
VTVLRWPSYLLKNIPPELRAEIEREAGPRSLAETIRAILCAHFSLDCDQVASRNRFAKINGTETMILRLQPELFREIRREAEQRSVPTRTVIIEVLEKHFAVT